MCGIVMVCGQDAAGRASAVLERLGHRGPDGRGATSAAGGTVALAHTRLAIVDLQGGAQPLASEDGRVVVVANGQIYNDRELRAELEARGHTFATNSDCEVLVHLYEEHGVAMLERLDGMFAFALWDADRGEVLLARDRLGIKPLAYAAVGGDVIVASEVRALLAHPRVAPQLDPEAVAAYLAFGFVPAPLAILRHAHKLPPATYAWVDPHAGTVRVQAPYWSAPAEPATDLRQDTEQDADVVLPLLEESVAARLRADVPLGIFLSGGIDSSLLAVMATRAGARPPCFVLGFEGELGGWDERPRARKVAAHLGLELHEVVAGAALTAGLPALAGRLDEPYADSSAILFDRLAERAREDVKVVLSGEGGDELFAGYPRHLGARLGERYDLLPPAVRHAMGALAAPLGRAWTGKAARLGHLHRFLTTGAHEADARYVSWLTLFDPDLRESLAPDVAGARAPEIDALALLAAGAANDPVARATRFDLVRYLPDDLLVKADRIGLGHALEVRVPFLGHVLVEHAMRLPGRVRLPGRRSKPILRALARRFLPPDIASARKGGFSLPLGRWLRQGRAPELQALLGPESLAATCPFLAADVVGQLLAAHNSGAVDHAHRLYALAALVAWCRAHDARL